MEFRQIFIILCYYPNDFLVTMEKDMEAVKILIWGAIALTITCSYSLLDKATYLKTVIIPGFQYQLVAYEKISEGETPITYVTLKFTNKYGVSVIHTFTNIDFVKDVSAANTGEKFTAIIKDNKIILI